MLALGLAAALALVPADTLRYSVLMAGREAGSQAVWRERDEIHARFEFRDRGRGPKIAERVRLDAAGLPTLYQVSGTDYYKKPVDERFARERGAAVWLGAAERGESRDSTAFYLTFGGSPNGLGILARALLARPDRSLALLPAGEARAESVGRLTVPGADGDMVVRQISITGIDFVPVTVWLDENDQLFAQGSSWFMVVRTGWEGAQPRLLAAQDSVAAVAQRSLASRLARRPERPIVIRGARLFDAAAGTVRDAQTVVVEGDRIARVGDDSSIAVPRDADEIDAGGRMLLPGLWDMHTHIGDDDGLLHLAAGVTSVRDLANDTDELLRRRERFERGELIGPRVIAAGFMDGPGEFAGPTKVLVATADEAESAVDRYADQGFVQIKVYSSIDPAIVPAIVRRAHARGLRVSGHVPWRMTAADAVRAGFDEIQHANFLLLNFWPDTAIDTRTPARFTTIAERAGGLDLRSAEVAAFLDLLAERGTVIDPTLSIFEDQLLARVGTVSPQLAAVADRLPPSVRRGALSGGLPVAPGAERRHQQAFATMMRLVRMAYDRGITIVPGTDAMPGFTLHRELELYAEAGIPPHRVLQIATIGAARVAGRDRELGTIEPGKLADLILVDGDPTRQIADIRNVTFVMRGGVRYDPALLYEATGTVPAAGRR